MNRNEMIGAICGTVLGDGCLQIAQRGKNAYLRLEHCIKQEEYLDYKIRIFSELCHIGKGYSIKQNPERKTVRAWSKCHPLLTRIRQWFYKDKKRVTDRILYRLTPLGLAFWYLDDGYLAYIKKQGKIRGREIKLYTYGYPYEDQEKIVSYFKNKYDLKWRIGRAKINRGPYKGKVFYYIATGAEEGNKFFKIIAPYVPESMKYKIDMKYSYSSYAGQPIGFTAKTLKRKGLVGINLKRLMIQSELNRNIETATEMIAA